MADNTKERTQREFSKQERYTHGYESKFVEYLKSRKVSKDAAFFQPHLKSGMNLIDCGCGPGTITIDLAESITPGHVVGIDLDGNQIKLAREHSLDLKVSNAKFEVGAFTNFHFPITHSTPHLPIPFFNI